MKLIHNIAQMQQFCQDCQNNQQSIALVPTMGGLHRGHFTLIKKAKQWADVVIVSIFVNPVQFGNNEDLATYPGTLTEDRRLLSHYPVDIIFAPSVQSVYPLTENFQIIAPNIANQLCGASRPVFFHGISLVVLKLLLITGANFAIFGQKDYQQLHIISQLIKDFYLKTKMISIKTVRDKDGLALSTRNQYLTPKQRAIAPLFYQTLQWAKTQINGADTDLNAVKKQALGKLGKDFEVDYFELVAEQTLQPLQKPIKNMRLMSAVLLGKIRLIDNIKL